MTSFLEENYYNWLCTMAIPDDSTRSKYSNLLFTLYNIEFIPKMDRDENRMHDGIDFKKQYAYMNGLPYKTVEYGIRKNSCSMLEMMVALSYRMEEEIMDDPDKGNRTSLWFKTMLESMELIDQTDDKFNWQYVVQILYQFNDRKYQYNGHFGLFTLNNPPIDMRQVEIWYQMFYYLEENNL